MVVVVVVMMMKMASSDSRLESSFQRQPSGQKDAADQNFDYMFKLLIIGNSSVGKTSFLFRYADDSFTSAFVSTVGIDFKVKTVFRNDKRIKLQIWDTAGQERYRTITTAYYRGAMGFLLIHNTAQTVFERLVDVICEKMNESLEGESGLVGGGAYRNHTLGEGGAAENQGGCS
ncbi:hypothetical protein CRUP_011353, partial [Coryphaenoides rupestris]